MSEYTKDYNMAYYEYLKSSKAKLYTRKECIEYACSCKNEGQFKGSIYYLRAKEKNWLRTCLLRIGKPREFDKKDYSEWKKAIYYKLRTSFSKYGPYEDEIFSLSLEYIMKYWHFYSLEHMHKFSCKAYWAKRIIISVLKKEKYFENLFKTGDLNERLI